jgi:hypothetical protein
MNYRKKKANTHKKRYNNKRKNIQRKTRRHRGGNMTTSVDTNPISYKDEEYKEMNELAFKGGLNTNTPESQGPMTLDELNISNISYTNDQLDDNDISGFAQNPDEDWELLLQQMLEQNNNNNMEDEEAYTDIESYPSFGSQNTNSSFPTSEISTITDDINTDSMSMGGKKRRRKTNKKRYNNKKRKTHRKK